MHGVFEDLTGKRFGRRVVLARADAPNPRANDHNTYWRVRCDCGNEAVIRGTTIAGTKRCRACYLAKRSARDLTGQRFGSRVVLGPAERTTKSPEAHWRVRCDCGREDVTQRSNLGRDRTEMCPACVRHQPKVTRTLLEVLILATEHAVVTPRLVVEELGADSQAAYGALRNAEKQRRLARSSRGVYALAPAGLALLRDIAEGRRVDRWRLRGEIVAALDGGRASGRSTVRGSGVISTGYTKRNYVVDFVLTSAPREPITIP